MKRVKKKLLKEYITHLLEDHFGTERKLTPDQIIDIKIFIDTHPLKSWLRSS